MGTEEVPSHVQTWKYGYMFVPQEPLLSEINTVYHITVFSLDHHCFLINAFHPPLPAGSKLHYVNSVTEHPYFQINALKAC